MDLLLQAKMVTSVLQSIPAAESLPGLNGGLEFNRASWGRQTRRLPPQQRVQGEEKGYERDTDTGHNGDRDSLIDGMRCSRSGRYRPACTEGTDRSGTTNLELSAEDWEFMASGNSVRCGDTTIEYQVRRSKRRKKTIQISVVGGEVRVAAPMRTPNSEIKAIVQKRAPWILRHISDPTPEVPPKRFVSGETLPYLGRDVPLVVEDAAVPRPQVSLDHLRFRITVPDSLTEEERYEAVRGALARWYRERASERMEALVTQWGPKVDAAKATRVLVRDQRRRWGSCAPDGTLRFNWRIVMLEPALVEYVAVHELAHLVHPNHSPSFWGLVSQVMPDAQDRRARLREEGRYLPL